MIPELGHFALIVALLLALTQAVLPLVGAQRDKAGRPLEGYDQYKVLAWIVTIVLVVLGASIGSIGGVMGAFQR